MNSMEHTVAADNAARQARFEHSEKPDVLPNALDVESAIADVGAALKKEHPGVYALFRKVQYAGMVAPNVIQFTATAENSEVAFMFAMMWGKEMKYELTKALHVPVEVEFVV